MVTTNSGGPALEDIKVLDLSRLAPGPYCSMLLADMGADVISVGGGRASPPIPAFARGKRIINLDLKSKGGRNAFYKLVQNADVLIESNRPGVMAKLGADYQTLRDINPRLIYCSLTGYGQTGPLAQEAGHDINYLGLSGALGAFGPKNDVPSAPLNLLADFAGGSLFAVIAILAALNERSRSNAGKYIDAAMVDGCLSMMSMHFSDWGKNVLSGRGDGLLAGNAPYYRCYRCEDEKFVAVGALERQFFENLWSGLGFDDASPDHLDRKNWPEIEQRLEAAFATKKRDAWVDLFTGADACVSAVLDPHEALAHPHNRLRHGNISADCLPRVPLPNDPSVAFPKIDLSDQTRLALAEIASSSDEIAAAVQDAPSTGGLSWPPM